jgi:SAM-dependent methyltransferase
MLDVPYPDFLCGLQLPEHLKYICSVAGLPSPDLSGGFTYCDLGCGQGRTASAIAALHPDAQIWGLDLSVDHILAARAFAERATLKNAIFMAVDLANFDPLSLPPLDFISMHGVWAWVPEQVREGILNLVMQRLKPGGLCYVSYNAMPGSVSLGAIRRMCLDLLEDGQTENLGVLLPQALNQLRSLSQADGLFFQKHPIAEQVIATADKADLRYMAHEYLADKWEPMSIKQVADTMRGAGLTWASSCILAHRLHAEGLPPQLLQEIDREKDRIRREVLFDICLNRQFRADISLKADDFTTKERMLENFHFALTTTRQAVPQRAVSEGTEIDTGLAPIPLILDALADEVLSFMQLSTKQSFGIDVADLAEVLMALVVVDVIRPLPTGSIVSYAKKPIPPGADLHPFNKAALATKHPEQPVTMIAPAFGGIVSIPPLDVALLETYLAKDRFLDVSGLRATLAESGISIFESSNDRTTKVPSAIARFGLETQPKLQRLSMLN